jgi:hypothetical protein
MKGIKIDDTVLYLRYRMINLMLLLKINKKPNDIEAKYKKDHSLLMYDIKV